MNRRSIGTVETGAAVVDVGCRYIWRSGLYNVTVIISLDCRMAEYWNVAVYYMTDNIYHYILYCNEYSSAHKMAAGGDYR